jgi:uncharacterized protein (TIGR02118 family)
MILGPWNYGGTRKSSAPRILSLRGNVIQATQPFTGENPMARMLVIYKTPQDTAAFDKHYFEVHVKLAKKLPGLRKYEVSRGAITTLAGGDAYMVAELHFDDLAAIRAAFASEVGKECGADRQDFAPDPAAFQMFLFEDRAV